MANRSDTRTSDGTGNTYQSREHSGTQFDSYTGIRTHDLKTAAPLGLFYGRSTKPMVEIVPDAKYPTMWRIRHPDGRLSDMANLTRIKDAAALICERGPPLRNRLRFHWKAVGEPPGASSIRQKEDAA